MWSTPRSVGRAGLRASPTHRLARNLRKSTVMSRSQPFEVLVLPFHSAGSSARRLAAVGAALLLLASARTARAGDGALDPGFGSGGKVQLDFNLSTDIAYAVALQGDGKVVTVGTSYVNNDYSNEDFALARLNPDGTLDATFGVGGRVKTDF